MLNFYITIIVFFFHVCYRYSLTMNTIEIASRRYHETIVGPLDYYIILGRVVIYLRVVSDDGDLANVWMH